MNKHKKNSKDNKPSKPLQTPKEILVKESSKGLVKRKVGRPTKYNNNMVLRTKDYVKECEGNAKKLPTIEELSLRLKIDDDTIVKWSKLHSEFNAIYKRLKLLQKQRLIEALMGRFNATGKIFLLKALHGLVDDPNKSQTPVQVNILAEHLRGVEVKSEEKIEAVEVDVLPTKA